jgi:hypothetical protein
LEAGTEVESISGDGREICGGIPADFPDHQVRRRFTDRAFASRELHPATILLVTGFGEPFLTARAECVGKHVQEEAIHARTGIDSADGNQLFGRRR